MGGPLEPSVPCAAAALECAPRFANGEKPAQGGAIRSLSRPPLEHGWAREGAYSRLLALFSCFNATKVWGGLFSGGGGILTGTYTTIADRIKGGARLEARPGQRPMTTRGDASHLKKEGSMEIYAGLPP